MKVYKIACIPGDGIGKEVVPAGQAVLQALAEAQRGFRFEFSTFGWGGDWYRAYGEMMPADGLEPLRNMDAILFGSAGDPDIPEACAVITTEARGCREPESVRGVLGNRIHAQRRQAIRASRIRNGNVSLRALSSMRKRATR